MPCFNVVEIKLELDAARIAVLHEAMERLGYKREGERQLWRKLGVSVALLGGRLTVIGRIAAGLEEIRSRILMETSKVIVHQAAKINGWQVRWTADNRAQVIRGGHGASFVGR